MVDAHPDIAMVPEIGWLADCYERRVRLTDDGMITGAFVDHLLERGSLGRYSQLPLTAADVRALGWTERSVHYAEALGAIFDAYARRAGKTLAGNKTVDLVRHVSALHELWPGAAIVHLIRDGRDVCLSANAWRRAPRLAAEFPTWPEDPVGTAALWWAWQVRLGREAGALVSPGRYMEIHYERLVSEPALELGRLCAASGFDYDPAMPKFHEGRTIESSPHDLDAKHAWRPPTPGLRDWRRSMRPDEVSRFEAVAGDVLAECGYEVTTTADPQERDALVPRALAGRVLPPDWLPHGAGGHTLHEELGTRKG